MRTYTINDASFGIPDTWVDRSVVVFISGNSQSPELSFVINRDKLTEGEELVDFAERQTKMLLQNLPQCVVSERRQRLVAGTLALEIEFFWTSERRRMHQRQVFLLHGNQVLVLTATAPDRLTPAQEEEVDHLMDSFHFREV